MILWHRETVPGAGHRTGRLLLRQMYESCTGCPMPEIRMTDRGKPYFSKSPLHFSITHTPHHVFCALSDCPVGIDAEETGRQVKPGLADKILSPREREAYDRAENKNEVLLRLWVLKEARAKYLGTGLTGYPKETDFSPEDPRIAVRDGCFLAVIRSEQMRL